MDRKGLGNKGERMAREWLRLRGFTILETNWRAHRREIDIIACKENILHFVEVKTRRQNNFGYPEAQVDRRKLVHLQSAASAYLETQPQWRRIQFDVLAIQYGEPPVIDFLEDLS